MKQEEPLPAVPEATGRLDIVDEKAAEKLNGDAVVPEKAPEQVMDEADIKLNTSYDLPVELELLTEEQARDQMKSFTLNNPGGLFEPDGKWNKNSIHLRRKT